MAEYIGSRISLISKRDIRYVGTLHEISSENSTVALENVVSFGTEGRRPDEEVQASDNVYDYIVFRGSDVKDLRIEEPKENVAPKPPQIPDDPAILGSARRPNSTQAPILQQQRGPIQTPPANQPPQTQGPQGPLNQPGQQNQAQQDSQRLGPLQFPQNPYQQYYPPLNQHYGMPGGGFPPGPGFRGMPYGPPPGWYPPPGHGPPLQMQGGNFYPPQMPIGPPGPINRQMGPPPPQQQPKPPSVASLAAEENKPLQNQQPLSKPQSPKPAPTVKLPSASVTPNPAMITEPPPPPTESKPDVAAALAPPAPSITQLAASTNKAAPTAPKSGRIVPAVPLASPGPKPSMTTNGVPKEDPFLTSQPPTSQAAIAPLTVTAPASMTKTIEEASRDARAAVRAAMAKLPSVPGAKKTGDSQQSAVDNLTAKVNEMKVNENNRHSRQPGFGLGHRGPRGGFRGNRGQGDFQTRKIEVPKTDYDFASANAKFNKQDLAKEATAGGSPVASTPIDTPASTGADTPLANGGRRESAAEAGNPTYNKNSSFFDDISSEAKDRTEATGGKFGGREFRSEERQKNMETFGQGSVDGNFRGGFRGRGRGRGFGRGVRGGYAPRGGTRGGQRGAPRGGAVAAEN